MYTSQPVSSSIRVGVLRDVTRFLKSYWCALYAAQGVLQSREKAWLREVYAYAHEYYENCACLLAPTSVLCSGLNPKSSEAVVELVLAELGSLIRTQSLCVEAGLMATLALQLARSWHA